MNNDTWIRRPLPNPNARLRLFCFPYAGVGASIFRLWPDGLPGDVDVCAVQLPGRETRLRETPFMRITELVETLLPIVQPYLDRPFALFGHSVGAWISYELCRQLRSQSARQPIHLFVSGRRAPHCPPSKPPMHVLSDDAFLEAVRTRYGGGAELVWQDAELMQFFLPILRADITMAETYEYTPAAPLECPITAFGGRRDENAGRAELDAWRTMTSEAFTVRMIPGDHFFVNEQRDLLLGLITQALTGDLRGENRGW